MHTKRIIPCLDVKDGRVVKGVNFVNLKDAGDPVEIGKAYDKAGADELVFLDITASSDGRNTVADMVRRVAETVFIPFTVGGGIRTVDDFRALLREGADKISINSSAINTPELISDAADKFGSQCVVVAIDAKRRADGSGWNIYKNGGRIDVGSVPKGSEREKSCSPAWTATEQRRGMTRSLQEPLPRRSLFRSSHREAQARRSIFTRRLRTQRQTRRWRHPCSTIRSLRLRK